MRSSKTMLAVATCLMLGFWQLGCVAPALIDSFNHAGVSKTSRKVLLEERMKDYHVALYWGRHDEASSFTAKENREQFAKDFLAMKDKEKIIETAVNSVMYSPEYDEAEAEVAVQYYRVPFYVVNKRVEKEKWRFAMGTGWQLVSRDIQG